MAIFRVQVDDKQEVVAGPGDTGYFVVAVQDTFSSDINPKVVVSAQEGAVGESIVNKTWLEEDLRSGSTVQISMLENGEIDTPKEFSEEPWPADRCSFCAKTSDEVEWLIAAKYGVAHICSECIDICRNEVENRRNEGTDPT